MPHSIDAHLTQSLRMFVVCRSQEMVEYWQSEAACLEGIDVVPELGCRSLYQLIGRIISENSQQPVLLAHDDILCGLNFGEAVHDLLKELTSSLSCWGICGNAGVTWDGKQFHLFVDDPHGGAQPGFIPEFVLGIDGNLMFLNTPVLYSAGVTMPDLNGFHGYDIALSLECLKRGLPVLCDRRLFVKHKSGGDAKGFAEFVKAEPFQGYLTANILNDSLPTINGVVNLRSVRNADSPDSSSATHPLQDVSLLFDQALIAGRKVRPSLTIACRSQFTHPELLNRAVASFADAALQAGDLLDINVCIINNQPANMMHEQVERLRNLYPALGIAGLTLPQKLSWVQVLLAGVETVKSDFVWFVDDHDYIPLEALRIIGRALAVEVPRLVVGHSMLVEEAWDDDGNGERVVTMSRMTGYNLDERVFSAIDGQNSLPLCNIVFPVAILRQQLVGFAEHDIFFEDRFLLLRVLNISPIEIHLVHQDICVISSHAGQNTVSDLCQKALDQAFVTSIEDFLRHPGVANPLLWQLKRIIGQRDEKICCLHQEMDRQLASSRQKLAERDQHIVNFNQTLAERDQQIVNFNQTLAERDQQIVNFNQTLAERDQHIAKHDQLIVSLNQALTKRDQQIVSFNQTLARRDQLIDSLNHELAEQQDFVKSVLSSRSWRLTAPLRYSKQLVREWIIDDLIPVFRRTKNALMYVKRGDFKGLSGRMRARKNDLAGLAISKQMNGDSGRLCWGIMATPHTLFVAHLIAEQLQKYDWKVDILFLPPQSFDHDLYLVICPQMFAKLPPGEKRISFQMEQSVSSRWFTDAYLEKLNTSLAVLEYSLVNIEYLAEKGIAYPVVHYLPVGSSTSYGSNPPAAEKTCDILFYGDSNSSPRRLEMLNALSEHFDLRIVSEVFGADIQREIQQSRLVVNLHYYENALLETSRIQECLSLGVPVVSEAARDLADYPELTGAVHFFEQGSISAMLDTVKTVLNNPVPDQTLTEAVSYGARRFSFMFDRFLVAMGFLPAAHVRGMLLPQEINDKPVVISLPETIQRRRLFEAENVMHCTVFDGIRYKPGWIGCGLSYLALAQHALQSDRKMFTVMEDDVIFPHDIDSKLNTIREYLSEKSGHWDIFAGTIASLHKDVKILAVDDYQGLTFVTIDKMTSTVFNIYSPRALQILASWNAEDANSASNTIDRFLEKQAGLRVVVTLPFLVGHREEVDSTLWGFQNTRYLGLISASEQTLRDLVALHLSHS